MMQVAHIKWESDLIKGCQQSERQAQKRLYEHYHGTMMGVCMRYAANREEALEIVNNGFLKVFKSIENYKTSGSFEGWIKRIMVNCGIDHFRRTKGAIRKIDEVNVEYDLNKGADSNVIASLAAEDILSLIQKLPPSYKIVFNLYAIEGYNHREIAEQLNISEGTSKSALSKARVKLQAMLQDLNTINNKSHVK